MTTQQRQLYWQQQLAGWHASNLSGAAFCKHYALFYHQFSYWRRKLAGDQLMPLTGEQINWPLDGYDISLMQGHKTLHYGALG